MSGRASPQPIQVRMPDRFTMGGGSVGSGFGRLRLRASTRNRPEKFAIVSGLGR
jgi:hypothetical protein